MNKPTLIVIDDEPNIGNFICKVVEDIGFDASHFLQAGTFIDQLSGNENIIILDLMMPDIDGVEVIRLLAEKGSNAALILISGFDSGVLHSAQELAHEHNMNFLGALQKPFKSKELKALLSSFSIEKIPPPLTRAPESIEANVPKETELRLAIQKRHIVPYYQPQIDMATGMLSGVEALARWIHPQNGIIQPFHFISLAESNGLIEDLTWLMLDQTARDWSELNIDATVSINLTASMFKDLTLPNKISSIINKYQLDTSQLILEVTESALIEELAKSLECLTRLRMKGFQLSIDDFGTGHSSLIQLHRIPFSELKIDRSFIMKMTQDPEAAAIVETVIILSHKLKMRSVAEGIEDESVLNALKIAGCDIAQGYHYAKPMPYADLTTWIKNRK